ncbi:hypothetical protein KUTeg_011806 [Tegillarca granosa]|uniref:TNFR-Cys domain-containing protein n=1 Tax=Tegillarca granosa TaxID=220873 RepID=A0ABQ9F165_TEGGR|nr:hypothetical protein KUTeg_011806 [Tegillarca granosa]
MVDFLRNSLILICFLLGVTISEKLNFKSEYVPDDKFDNCNQGGDFHLTPRQREEKTADFYVYTENLHVRSLNLSVPHYGNIVYLDIIQSTQVELVFEEEKENNELLNFELQTISPYADMESELYMYHTALSSDKGLHITLYVAHQQPVFTSSNITVVIFTTIVLVFTAAFLYNNLRKVQLREYVSYCRDTTPSLSPATTSSEKEETLATGTDKKHSITSKCRNYFLKTLFFGKDDGLMESLTDNVTVTEFPTVQEHQAPSTPQGSKARRKPYLHGSQNHNMGTITHQHLKSVPLPVIFCLCVTLTVAVVFAWRTASSRYILKVGIPNSAHIRKVRSYSEKPDLAGININTSSINLLTKLQLIDVDDSCKGNLTSCHTHAYCDVDSGTFNCICRRGYYVDQQTCRECSTKCPDGYYMSEPCTSHKNVVCKACTECVETAYEAAPCRTTNDRICLDVSFPVNHIKWKGTSPVLSNTTIDVTSSKNVFIDKLGKIRNLDTVVYITNNQQSMEFFYGRPSGLEIKIKVSEIFLVPSYVDLDHIDDTPFFITYKEPMQDLKDRYNKIQEKYCRHPLPDHYKMILEVIRNITSAASYTACDPSHVGSPRCQNRYKEGNKYLNRYLDVQCPKTQGSFEHLKKHPNVIYCPYITTLLTKTFGLKPSELEALSFPTQQCQKLKQDCEKCIYNNTCPNNQDPSPEGDCCSIPCYSTRACSQAFSSTCPQKPVECAAGDVYMFILEPLFEMLGRQYMCHLKYRKPIQLYQVDYQVDILDLKYSLRRKQHIVKAPNKTVHQHSKFNLDFMSIEHVAFPEISDEVVVIGNRFDTNHSAQKFTMYPLKKPSDFNKRKKFNVRPGRDDINRNVYSTHVQLERPFLYSSSVWYRGGCVNKNFSQFYPAQHIYKHKPIEIDPNIMKSDDYFEYQVTPIDRVPYIKFFISGDESILKYYKSDFQTAQLNGSSLQGDLEWNHDNKTWLVSINGTLLSCPAYITTDIYDKYMVAKLGHFDVFVKCPPSFQMSFSLQQPSRDTPDIFIVIVNDSATSHRIVLSLINKPVYLPVNEMTSLIPISSTEYPWIPIIITFVLTVIILTAFLLLGIYIGQQETNKSMEKL